MGFTYSQNNETQRYCSKYLRRGSVCVCVCLKSTNVENLYYSEQNVYGLHMEKSQESGLRDKKSLQLLPHKVHSHSAEGMEFASATEGATVHMCRTSVPSVCSSATAVAWQKR
ncbi:unnamed protein product [Caretta caretta]